ncbi:hypothetical protein ACH4TE_19860 [Streptomyces sioyaensis]|uniref:hypothetical protein n=1 Tax=Streptomyces sioyaensis TaxID=67364 RepID=UPI0037B83AE6
MFPKTARPAADFPGLRVKAGSQYTTAEGDYVCGCGAEDHANGDADVKALVEDYTAHKNACTGRGVR